MGWGSFRRKFIKKVESSTKNYLRGGVALASGDLKGAEAYVKSFLRGHDEPFDEPPAAPDQPNVEFNLDDPFSSEGEFSKGAQKARSGTSLEREDLIAAFVDKNTITAGDFSQGSGAVF